MLYYNLTGSYPESVHVDPIYRIRENPAWCRERGIRISGLPLGRPPANVSKEKKKQALEDEKIRSSIEGKLGVSKRRFSLARVMTKLANTSETEDCYYFFGHEYFYLAETGFFCRFLPRIENNTCLRVCYSNR